MITTAVAHAPLAERLWHVDTRAARLARNVTLALGGSALLALSAKLQIPFIPVPMTMQTFAVLVIAMAYGWKLGSATVLTYLAQGALGLPVFAYGGGLAYLAGPLGGYLVGFVAAAALCGFLAERGFDRRRSTTLVAMISGTASIFVFGVARLASFVGFEEAVQVGLVAMLPAAAFKIALATLVLPLVWQHLGRASSTAS